MKWSVASTYSVAVKLVESSRKNGFRSAKVMERPLKKISRMRLAVDGYFLCALSISDPNKKDMTQMIDAYHNRANLICAHASSMNILYYNLGLV